MSKDSVRQVQQRVQDAAKPATLLDRALARYMPETARRRQVARMQMALAGGYVGGSKSRRSLKAFNPLGNSADADLLPDLPTVRERSRDLNRNTPVAAGAVNGVVTSVVGPGLRVKPDIDGELLGMDEEEVAAWERQAARLWNMWAGKKGECDATRTQTFADMQAMLFRGALESGDIFVLMHSVVRNGSPFRLRLNAIEADRVENKDFATESAEMAGGVEMDGYGAPEWYHILEHHPGDYYGKEKKWHRVKAFGLRSGRRQVLHLYDKLRPGQTRGVPYLAPVIESLKQIGEYTDAELMAAVVSGMFTVFIETENGDTALDITNTGDETGATASDDDIRLGNGAIVGLAEGEKVSSANPGRPNAAFDPFVMAILRQIGAALEIPFEVLIKHFSASYSASRAALLEAWRFYRRRRKWLVDNLCQPVYEEFITEQVAAGRLDAPGFLEDPFIRDAYLGTEWRGMPMGHIQPAQEANAMKTRTETGVTTLEQEIAEYNGGDWERTHKQSVREHKARKEDGLSGSAPALPEPDDQQSLDDMKDNQ